ncbi:MAG: hypothetical protein IAF38_19815 [Bacteroidia bacterium]|nr:hypothetical protein [Bacteroidia bacterium]
MKKNIFKTLLPALTFCGALNAQYIPHQNQIASQFPSLENVIDTCNSKKPINKQSKRVSLSKQDSTNQNTAKGTLFIIPDADTTKRNKNATTNAGIDQK